METCFLSIFKSIVEKKDIFWNDVIEGFAHRTFLEKSFFEKEENEQIEIGKLSRQFDVICRKDSGMPAAGAFPPALKKRVKM